ncbi:MAG: single-stranded DNA-binding protein [Salinimicrobium sediminis]|uniref:Single-stranded DNA-binding protein n=1 Tax=Salinimicrobium sediminis TaxID=1343891 RepID=A0A285X151_9FLAO|nr:single-stranded DNA-binding protein [Salinimicrobium sediminis]MDX1601439.1 single-stranded DNA-binding protein [Salinimicrobium sediminis]MDX1754373.1 single-stranded DNA-binding protein [Salinimicrobium sediminis]SOC79073.1 single-strand binding protein [Salinimicrobium sediminis]
MTGTLNKVMLIGHTGDDVKMHYFEGGGSIGRFPLATNEVYTNKTSGERVTNTEWHNVVVRNKAAEICEKYLKKGDKVYIEGRIKTRKWQDDKGVERYSTEIHCTDFTFLTPKDASGAGDNSGSGYGQQQQSQSKPQATGQSRQNSASNQSQSFTQEDDDDLPF